MRRRWVAFSFVEVILGLVILALLISITISFYEEDASRAREDSSRARLATFSEAIKRWELEHRREYPHSSLGPLVGKYIDHVGTDPWGSSFAVDPARGYVYSFGPNGSDERGDGDDARYPFRTPTTVTIGKDAISGGRELDNPETQRQKVYVLPSAPSQLTFDLQRQQIRWRAPETFEDGSVLDTATHLAGYRVYVRKTTSADELAPNGVIASPSTTSFQVDTTSGASLVYVVKAFYLDKASNPIESKPSNQAGVFQPKTVGPVVTRFIASSYSPPVENKDKKFTFSFELFDADSNLRIVQLTLPNVSGSPFTAWPPSGMTAGQMRNRFQVSNGAYQPSGGFVLATTGPINGVELRATDDSNQTTAVVLPQPIVVTNTPPTVTLRADRTAIIRGSSPATDYQTTVLVTAEARDTEDNLASLTITRENGPETFTVTDGTSSLSGIVTINTSGPNVVLRALAKDKVGASGVDEQTIVIAADETPPETAEVNMNASNPGLERYPPPKGIFKETDEEALKSRNWYVKDACHVTATWTSFEAETPPVHYRLAISTVPPPLPPLSLGVTSTLWTDNFVPEAVTRDPVTGSGWVTPRPDDTVESYTISCEKGELIAPLENGKTYYLAVQALNSANPPISNGTYAQPRNPSTGLLQNGFYVDTLAPQLASSPTDPGIDLVVPGCKCSNPENPAELVSVVAGTPKFIDGVAKVESLLSVKWSFRDPGDVTPPGNLRYLYQITAETPGGIQTLVPPTETRTPNLTNQVIRAGPTDVMKLEVWAFDFASNQSTAPATFQFISDTSAPSIRTTAVPIITNATGDNVLTDPNTIKASWQDVFVDQECPNTLSFKWGLSTTRPIQSEPDRKAFVDSDNNGASPSTNANAGPGGSLVSNGETIYLVVQARNCATLRSDFAYSEAYTVRTGCFSRLSATPIVGFQPLTVNLRLEIAGDANQVVGPFDYALDFSDKSADTETFSLNGTAGTSVTASHTYSIIGNHRAFGQVTGAGGCKAFALAAVQVLPQPYILALGRSSLSVVDLAAPQPVLARFELPSANLRPARLRVIEITDTLKFVLFTAAGNSTIPGGVFRFDLNSVSMTAVATEATNDLIDDISVSSDFITVMLTNLKGGSRSLRRLSLDPTLNYESIRSRDAVFSMGVGSPAPATGNPAGVTVALGDRTAIAVDANGGLFDSVVGLFASRPGVASAQPLGITTPGYIDLSADGTTLAVPDRATSKLVLATVAEVDGEPRITATTSVTLSGLFAADVEIAPDKKSAFAGEATGGKVARVNLSSNSFDQAPAVAAGPVAGLDVSRDSSLLVVGDSTGNGTVKLLKASTMEVLGSAALTDGCRDVAFFERPAFGKPVITSLSPATASRGASVDARGFNLGPVDANLQVTLISDSPSVPTTLAAVVNAPPGTNGFSSLRFVVPVDYPAGTTTVVVATKQGSTTPSSTAKLNVQ
ncbi:MAG: hypothetical protein HY816_20440 [Candidatus Wallbacteria bacterium]|nr:hypothetical protein [Candidatus Wallbacteria bacterium]